MAYMEVQVRKKKPRTSHITSGYGGRMRLDGLPVVDAKKPLILEVTADDIKHSNPLDPAGCAAAIAAMRQEGVTKAFIHLSKAYIMNKQKTHYERYEAPRRLRTEVVAYDRGGSFEPNEFELKAPSASKTVEGARKYREDVKKKYRLQVPRGQNALPKKSTWKTYGTKGIAGAKPRKHKLTKVRSQPKRK